VTLLRGLRVVELAGRYSGRVTGGLLAALGADVTLIATANGETDEFPLVDPAGGASTLALDRSKRVHQATPEELRRELPARLASADILITSGENGADGDPALQRRFGLGFGGVQVDISPYGASGPCRAWKAADLTIGAHAGLAVYVGEPDRPPLVPPVQLISHQAGLAAAVAAVAASPGAVVEVAEFDVMATTHVSGLYSLAFFSGPPPHRAGRRKPAPYPFTHLPCADGWVCIAFLEGRHWARFVEAMGSPAWAEQDRYRNRRAMGEQYPDEVDALVIDWLRSKTKAELRALALERGLPIAPLRTLDELLQSEQLASRRFFEPVDVGGSSVDVPGLPWRIQPARGPEAEAAGPAPLAGRLVLDLGRVASAPAVGQWLADLGADVIKVESRTHLDSARKGRPLLAEDVDAADAGQTPNLTPYFQAFNRGKRSITLDLASPDGRLVLEALIPQAAVLVENFGAKGLERFGLGPDRLHELNPALVVVRISAVGQDGPEAALPGYAPHSTAAAGLDNLCGYEGADPVGMIASNMGDINTAAYATLGALAALRTGAGTTIDISMLEANATHLAPLLVEHQLSPSDRRPTGNGHRAFAPHGIYPTADGGWLAVTVRTSGERAALIAAVAAEAASSADAASGCEAAVAAWALGRSAEAAAETLQNAGVPAAPVLAAEDLLFDEHVRAREVVVDLPHPVLGMVPAHGVPFRSTDGFTAVRGRAPNLGEHTREVLSSVGYSPEETAKLEAAGAFDGPL